MHGHADRPRTGPAETPRTGEPLRPAPDEGEGGPGTRRERSTREPTAAEPVRFDAFTFHPSTRVLQRGGKRVPLPPKASEVLAALVGAAGELVTREQLHDAAWGATIVEFDQSLNTCIRQIRAALGDDARSPRFIETIPRRGYRFCCRVVPLTARRWPIQWRPAWKSAALPVRVATAAALMLAWWFGIQSARRLSPAHSADSGLPAVQFTVPFDSRELIRLDHELEAAVRSQWLRSSPDAGSRSSAATADLVIAGIVVAASDGARLHARIQRVSDGTIVWTGTFNPLCPDVADPVATIGYLLADQLRRYADRTT